VRHVPGVLNAVANKFEDLRELLVDGKEEVLGETFSHTSVSEDNEEEDLNEDATDLEQEFVFPITIDDGSEVQLVISRGDDVPNKVRSFCGAHMPKEGGCYDQLLPLVRQRLLAAATGDTDL
jgi:hypothetical protein